MRRRFSISVKGTTLKELIKTAQSLLLHARPLKFGIERLGDLKLPCVVLWDLSHFVVLKEVRTSSIILHDPAVGERQFPMREASLRLSGVALELTPSASFSKKVETRKVPLSSLVGRVVGLKAGLIRLLILGAAMQVCALLAPFYLQWVVDEALVASDQDLVTVLALGFLAIAVIQTAIGAVRSWITTALSTDLNFQWLGNAFAHLLKLPLQYFEKRHLGDIASRFGSIQSIQRSLTTQFVEAVLDGLLVLATLAVMLLYSPALSAVAVSAVALYALARWGLFHSLREATTQQIEHAARQQTLLLESIQGVQSIRLFGRSEERRICWMNALADQVNAELRIARLSISYQSISSFLLNVERVIVIWLAAFLVIDGRFSVGMLLAFLSYKDQFSHRIASLIDKVAEFRMLRLHAERVADIILTPCEQDERQQSIDHATVMPSIELRNVSFRYGDGEPLVIDDLNLFVPPGQCLAVAGASGCGKTTLVKLLLGLLVPTQGKIFFGGKELTQWGMGNYREMVGTVMQDDQMFSGSIADNISFFDSAPDQQRIEVCARLAAIEREISSMPMCYHTLIGDLGTGISGGQKQRILLARALYKQPRALVMDEATSHLDLENEHLVNAAIQKLPLTRVMIAHRPETISMAHRVVVLESGRIVRSAPATHAIRQLAVMFAGTVLLAPTQCCSGVVRHRALAR
jgi:ATP-binding cassette subfamily B protein RaxB